MLRAALEVSNKASTKLSHRLMRDQRKMHQLYSQLTRLGFGVEEVECCLAEMKSDAAIPDCLDWCSLHLPDHLLPPAFRVTGSGDESLPAAQPQVDKKKEASAAKALAAAEETRQRQMAQQKAAAEEKAAKAAARANETDWMKKYAQRMEEEAGSSDAEYIHTSGPPNRHFSVTISKGDDQIWGT